MINWPMDDAQLTFFAPDTRPKIVCLCGSTRFSQAFQEANLRETLAGRIVLTIGCDLQTDNALWPDQATFDQIKPMLDELHMQKIALADEVFILNVGGYVGESTQERIVLRAIVGEDNQMARGEVMNDL